MGVTDRKLRVTIWKGCALRIQGLENEVEKNIFPLREALLAFRERADWLSLL